ncbi:MAG: hypothetical protein KDE48_19390 [Anaerolineales bacterium]|nr:hypothetical protein [Anaerolineales bacterium]
MKIILRIFLLILTMWPIIYLGFFARNVFEIMLQEGLDNNLYLFHTGTILILFGLLIIYLINLYRNEEIDGNQKMLWLLGFIMLSSFVMIVYWIKFIWQGERNLV